jgi:hypothetical protein
MWELHRKLHRPSEPRGSVAPIGKHMATGREGAKSMKTELALESDSKQKIRHQESTGS